MGFSFSEQPVTGVLVISQPCFWPIAIIMVVCKVAVGRLINGLFNKNYSRILLQFGRLGIWEIPFIFKPKKQVKGIVSLLQILNYFSHCFKKWRNFSFTCVKNSFRMKIRIMVGDDITHTHSFFPIDFRILGK